MTFMLPKTSRLRPYYRIFRTALRQEGANPKRLIIGNVASIFRITLLAFIYKVAYEFGGKHSLSSLLIGVGLKSQSYLERGRLNFYYSY